MRGRGTRAKLLKLQRLYDGLTSCKKCNLHVTRTNVVLGDGSVNAGIFLVGEAPGQEEDIRGRPFVGRSGKRLNTILNVLGVDRVKLYITNVVKCRPPYNRVPHKREVNKCIDWLEEEINIVSPRAIIPLGATAMNHIFDLLRIGNKESITANRGSKFMYGEIGVFPTFHPSYVLRNRELARTVREDIQRAIDYAKRKRGR